MTTLKRRSQKRSEAQRRAQERFHKEVSDQPCLFYQTRADHLCSGPVDSHHAIPKQFLKAHFSTLDDNERLIWHPDNGVALCRKAHELVTTHATYVFMEELPVRVVDWAEAWGVKWRLERECPSLSEVGDAA